MLLLESRLPKNFVAWLVGIRIVHLFAIIFELSEQLVHIDVETDGNGYNCVKCSLVENCQWLTKVKPAALGLRHALPIIIWLSKIVINHGLVYLAG